MNKSLLARQHLRRTDQNRAIVSRSDTSAAAALSMFELWLKYFSIK